MIPICVAWAVLEERKGEKRVVVHTFRGVARREERRKKKTLEGKQGIQVSSSAACPDGSSKIKEEERGKGKKKGCL